MGNWRVAQKIATALDVAAAHAVAAAQAAAVDSCHIQTNSFLVPQKMMAAVLTGHVVAPALLGGRFLAPGARHCEPSHELCVLCVGTALPLLVGAAGFARRVCRRMKEAVLQAALLALHLR